MSSTVLFEYDTAEVEINGPRGDQPYNPLPRFVRGMSQAGETYSYQTSNTNLRNWSLTFDAVDDQQMGELQNFFDAVVFGPSAQFDYTHTDGVTRQCRFVNVSLPWQRVMPNVWSLSVVLEVEDAGGFVPSASA